MSEFAFFIWSAYGVSLVALSGLTFWVLSSYFKAKARLAELEARK